MSDLPIIKKPCEDCGFIVPDRDDPTFAGAWLCYSCHCKRTGRDEKKALNDLATIIKGLAPDAPEFDYPNKGCFYICVGCAAPIEHRGMCKGCSNAYDIGRKQLAIDILSFGKPELRELMKKFINGERA